MNERITYLIAQLAGGTASKEELAELFEASTNTAHEAQIHSLLDKGWDELHEEAKRVYEPQPVPAPVHAIRPAHRVFFMPRRWWTAAAVFLLLGAATWVLVKQPVKQNTVAKADLKAPQKNRAMITLPDGNTVYLDSVGKGQLAMQENMKLEKLGDGQVAYIGTATSLIYNTLTNPRGSKVIDMILSDGSHVWLNAGSSITYPVAFVGKTRKVEIKGEGYFEVSHDANKPFIVSKDAVEVTVLGTHFNVNAYDNEPGIKVTLLEGSVKVDKGKESYLLKPNQQAFLPNSPLRGPGGIGNVITDPDIEQAMAWKNGMIAFHSMDIQAIIREIERWYDVSVETKGELPAATFYADLYRSAQLSEVLAILEMNHIHYSLDVANKKLVLMP